MRRITKHDINQALNTLNRVSGITQYQTKTIMGHGYGV